MSYILYLLRETQFAGELCQNPYLASLGLQGQELQQRLNQVPGVQFRKISDVSDLTWSHPSLWEWAQSL